MKPIKIKIEKIERFFGYSDEYLDSVTCFLTHRGADLLGACENGLNYWEFKFGKRRKFESSKIFEIFGEYSPFVFVRNALFDLYFDAAADYYRYTPIIPMNSDLYKEIYLEANKNNVTYVNRWLKAIIIDQCKKKEKQNENRSNKV